MLVYHPVCSSFTWLSDTSTLMHKPDHESLCSFQILLVSASLSGLMNTFLSKSLPWGSSVKIDGTDFPFLQDNWATCRYTLSWASWTVFWKFCSCSNRWVQGLTWIENWSTGIRIEVLNMKVVWICSRLVVIRNNITYC